MPVFKILLLGKQMEKGNWPLDKIDKEALKESQAAFVFGQMNEPANHDEAHGVV